MKAAAVTGYYISNTASRTVSLTGCNGVEIRDNENLPEAYRKDCKSLQVLTIN